MLCTLHIGVEEVGEIFPQRYTLLTDALSSDDESCSEWQFIKAELSDWDITARSKTGKKKKRRRKKKKAAQTADCPGDTFVGEKMKQDSKQGLPQLLC